VSHVHLDTRDLAELVRVTAAWHIRALRVKETTRRLRVAGWSRGCCTGDSLSSLKWHVQKCYTATQPARSVGLP